MKRSLLTEIAWGFSALLISMVQISIVMNWNDGKFLNIIIIVCALLTVVSKKRAYEIALVSGIIVDALSATPFGLNIIAFMVFILLLHVLTRYLFHTSVLYTVGLSTGIASIISVAFYQSVSSFFLFQNLSVIITSTAMSALAWQGLLHGIIVTVLLWWWHHQPRIFKRSYGI